MPRQISIAAVAVCLTSFAARGAEILNLGDAAPPLNVSDWVKGKKIEKFEPGQTYVVEFWATWCGPCRASIPHLTELAHQYRDKDVGFVGVDVFEHDIKLVKPFIEEMGDKMDYSVALDSVPEKGEAKDGAMAKGWMDSADEHGIPTAFVVHDGKIAWIGHPMSMDEPLAKITSGKWSLGDMAKQRLADKATERKVRLVRQKIFTPYRAHDYRATLAAIDEATSGDPDLADEFAWLKFVSLCKVGDIEPALELGSTLLEKYSDNAGRLNSTFWDVIDPALDKEPDPRVAQLALRAARRAVELTNSEDPYYLDTLAEALFRTGDAKAAEATEEKVLQLLKARGKDQSDEDLKEFKERLDRYRKGAT